MKLPLIENWNNLPLCTPFFTRLDGNVYIRRFAEWKNKRVRQIELTYTLCAPIVVEIAIPRKARTRFQKAGVGLVKGRRCLRGPNMRASSRSDQCAERSSASKSRLLEWPFPPRFSRYDVSMIKPLWGVRINLPARAILGGILGRII